MTLWTPTNLATAPKGWFKADDLGLSNGASVVTWPDSSGNALSVFTPGWASSPTFQTNQLNSLAIVRFTTAQALRTGGLSLNLPYTLMITGRTTGGTVGRVISGFADTSANWLIGWDTTQEDQMYMGGYVNNPATAVTTLWRMYGATGDGATAQLYRDGATLANNSGGLTGLDSRISLNGAYENSANAQSDCEMAELIFCNYVMTITDRQLVEGYMAWKWGRQASLPAGHPYANAAPTTDVVSGPRPQAVPFTRGAGGGGKI